MMVRLLHCPRLDPKASQPHKFEFSDFAELTTPPCGTLSHVWARDEVLYGDVVLFGDVRNGAYSKTAGHRKLQFCADRAHENNLEYIWIDACCVDRSDSGEVQAAVNSSFRRYRDSEACFVYLDDVPDPVPYYELRPMDDPDVMTGFQQSAWFTRTWTLHELPAPRSVTFYTAQGTLLGNRTDLRWTTSAITGIQEPALMGIRRFNFTLDRVSIWAKGRRTTLEEDDAYSLMGFFGVFMPTTYGEGRDSAFTRLAEEIAARRQVVQARAPYHEHLDAHQFRLMLLSPGPDAGELKGTIRKFDLRRPPSTRL